MASSLPEQPVGMSNPSWQDERLGKAESTFQLPPPSPQPSLQHTGLLSRLCLPVPLPETFFPNVVRVYILIPFRLTKSYLLRHLIILAFQNFLHLVHPYSRSLLRFLPNTHCHHYMTFLFAYQVLTQLEWKPPEGRNFIFPLLYLLFYQQLFPEVSLNWELSPIIISN